MKGIELAERFYDEFGKEMLEKQFPHLLPYLAVGLVGSGSECMGFDDEISRDHDFEAGFCIFLPNEDLVSSRDEFQLLRAYSALPKEFMGVPRLKINPVGGNRHGVLRIADFMEARTGSKTADLSLGDWFSLDEQFLLEVTGGKIFFDNLGVMTALREKLSYLPEDVRLKKLAGNLVLMAQSGQYNYARCVGRGDTAAAQLSLCEFVNAALKVIFLLNKKYIPYYKWVFRALSRLEILSSLGADLEFLISSGNGEALATEKAEIIEKIASLVIEELKNQGLTELSSPDLEPQAYQVNEKIKDPKTRGLNIMCAI